MKMWKWLFTFFIQVMMLGECCLVVGELKSQILSVQLDQKVIILRMSVMAQLFQP